ncbi:MAG: SusC/RagA family TonB-linked outer membrane protein [Flavobacteriales bacterium]|nr:SusC/RagA family TonB-linked outer membrane protein [Flavobacteriales bacterium]
MKKLLLAFGFIGAILATSFSQGRMVSGTVTAAEDGLGLPGVTVVEKGTQNATFSDIDGNFTLPVSGDPVTLVFSFIGYRNKEVNAASNQSVNVQLDADIAGLEEVIVVGYGNQKRSKISGAVGTIDTKEITSLPVLRTEQALQGRAAGVQVTQNSGQPGSTQSIRIRGTGSLNNAEPLYVIDGIPSGGIDYLNPADIESISILKDAASAAIYGARGGNGVVLITTKTGSKGQKPQITYESYYGIQEPWKYMALLNAEEYAILMNESRSAAGLAPLEALSNPSVLGEGFDWQDEILQRAPMMNHSFSFTKGTKTSSTAVGGSYFTQDGIIGGEKGRFERYTFRINTRQDGGERFRMGQNVNFTHLNRSALAENNEFATPVGRALNMDPITTAQRPDGSYAYSEFIDSDIANPANQIALNNDFWTTNRFVGSTFAEFDILSNLKFRSTMSVDLSLGSQRIFYPSYDLGIGPNDPNRPAYEFREVNSLVLGENKWSNWQWENTVNYEKELKNGDDLQVIAGYSALNNMNSNFYGSRDSLASNDVLFAYLSNSMNNAEQAPTANGGISESSFIGQFVRVNYSLGEAWSLAGTVRRDGSSRFGKNNRYGIFPSLSAAYNMTELPWVAEKDWIDFLKLRASWGQNGNADGIGNFDYTSLIYNGLNYTFGSEQVQVNGAGPINTSNPDLKWETVEQTNIGVDADLYKGKLNIVADYFVKNTNDMLAVVPLPGVVGFLPSATNVASARNSGFEFMVNHRNQKGLVEYEVGGNISFIRNEVTDLGEGGQPISTGSVFGIGDLVAYTEIGMPIAYFYGYETAGIFQTDEEAAAYGSVIDGEFVRALPNAQAGDVIFVDQNGDGAIDADDKTMIGNPHPDFSYGFNASMNYKAFDFSLFLQGTHGNDVLNGVFRYDLNTTNLPVAALERWTGEGTSDLYPRISHSDPNQNNRISDRFVEDGSFLRIKNVQVGYTLPESLMQRLQIGKCRVYVAASNLFTFTSYSGLDPEIGTRGTLEIGIDRGFYPAARTFMAGVNVNF